MGWERKRGKLLELHRLVLGRPDTTYRWICGDFAQQLDAGGFTFVYTLDEANWLAHDEVRSLLRVAAHPANRAELDDAGRLVGGYAIFQPSIVPVSGGALTSAETIQRAATTRFHFDVLGVGVFQGKGLLDVRACNALLDDVFPPGAVLHHDMLEGFAARTAEVHDAFVLEVSAPDYLSQVQRGHRWLRGYFQALPWIMPRVRGGDGARRTNPLRPIHRFFIFELVLTELARPASLVLLLAGWLTMPTHALAWTVLVCPPLAVLLARLVATTLGAAVDAIRRALAPAARAHGPRPFPLAPLAVEALAMLFSQATLPYEAVVVADALRRATWRMLVTRRHLLEWTPVSRVNPATLSEEPSAYWRELRACHAAGLLTLAVVAALRPSNLLVAIPFVAAWIGAPWMVAWFDGALGHTEAQPVAGAADAYGVGLEPERGAA